MSPCRSLTRRSILQMLAGSSLTQMVRADSSANLTLAVEQGFQRLDARYWSPELSIWLDRPGNDLRAWFEGRLNPPWWSCANAVETLADFMAATGNRRWIAPLAELHRYHRECRRSGEVPCVGGPGCDGFRVAGCDEYRSDYDRSTALCL